MEIAKELAACHAPLFECQCSVLYSIIIHYFFTSGFVNVILLQRHVCVGRERNFAFMRFLVICLLRGLQYSFADRPGQVCPSPVSDFQTYNLNTLNTHCGLLLFLAVLQHCLDFFTVFAVKIVEFQFFLSCFKHEQHV